MRFSDRQSLDLDDLAIEVGQHGEQVSRRLRRFQKSSSGTGGLWLGGVVVVVVGDLGVLVAGGAYASRLRHRLHTPPVILIHQPHWGHAVLDTHAIHDLHISVNGLRVKLMILSV